MNYAPDTAAYGGPPTITAIAADGTTILESYNLATDAPISTPQGVNDGAYRGISRGVADIAFIRISGSYLIMHDLTLVGGEVAPVPEPATFGLAGLVLASIVVLRRRLKG